MYDDADDGDAYGDYPYKRLLFELKSIDQALYNTGLLLPKAKCSLYLSISFYGITSLMLMMMVTMLMRMVMTMMVRHIKREKDWAQASADQITIRKSYATDAPWWWLGLWWWWLNDDCNDLDYVEDNHDDDDDDDIEDDEVSVMMMYKTHCKEKLCH